MNPLSVFNFSGLIKTFLPGFILVTAFFFLTLTFDPDAVLYLRSYKEIAILVAIIASIISGLICNTFVFCIGLHLVIRGPHERNPRNKPFYHLLETTQQKCINMVMPYIDPSLREEIAPDALIVDKDNLALLVYWMERYWFYMEFQINAVFATFVLMLAHLAYYWTHLPFHCCTGAPDSKFLFHIFISFALIGIVFLLKYAARQNYDRHLRRLLSISAARVSQMQFLANSLATDVRRFSKNSKVTKI